MAKDKLNHLDVDTWVEMLKSDDIQVISEEEVFSAILRYANQEQDKQKRFERLEKMLPHVRFTMLSTTFLFESVEKNPALEGVRNIHQLLHETYRYRAFPAGAHTTFKTNPRRGTMMFDVESCNPSISISQDKLTATNNNRQNTWCNIRCFPPYSEGISYREFKLKFTNYVMVGVETKDSNTANLNQYPGQSPNGWCWYSAGQTYHANNCVQSQSPFSSGDTVGVLVDTFNNKIAFYRNGKPVKAAFSGLPKDTVLYPVISFYNSADTATIVPGKVVPNKYPKDWNLGSTITEKNKKADVTMKRRKTKS